MLLQGTFTYFKNPFLYNSVNNYTFTLVVKCSCGGLRGTKPAWVVKGIKPEFQTVFGWVVFTCTGAIFTDVLMLFGPIHSDQSHNDKIWFGHSHVLAALVNSDG